MFQAPPSALSAFLWTLAATVPCALLGVFAWRRRRASSGHRLFVALSAAVTGWCLITALERLAPSLEGKLLWARVGYLPLVAIAPLWFLFTVEYTGIPGWLTGRRRWLAFLPAPITLALVATQPLHGLIWRRVAWSEGPGAPSLVVERGAWFWLGHAGWAWTLTVAGVVLAVAQMFRVTPHHRPQLAVLAGAPLAPLIANVLYVSGAGPAGPYDPTPLGFGLASLLLFWGLTHRGLLDLAPLAYEAVVAAIDESVIVLDDRNRILALNPAAERRLGQPARAVIGRDAGAVYSRWPEAIARFRDVESARVEITVPGENGPRDVEVRIMPLHALDGSLSGRVVTTRDLRVQRAYERLFEQVANNDQLTGLPNRRALQHFAEKALAFAQRRGDSAALLFLDLDAFKAVNDEWGHSIGNEVLAQIAQRLEGCVRRENMVARLAGDEFAVLLQGVEGEGAEIAAWRLIGQLAEPLQVAGGTVRLGASVGISRFPSDGRTLRELLRCADVAMYQAKRTGSKVVSYDLALEAAHPRRISYAEEIRAGLDRGQFVPVYQPIVETRSGKVVAVEALARWRHPERGLLLPSEFLPIADGRKVARGIDRAILERAAQEIAPTGLDLSVNVSIARLLDDELEGQLLAELARHGLPARRLILEITETELATPDQAGPVLRRLREHGIRVATDDFGSGYSSLAYLRTLPLDLVKIDRSLIANLGRRREDEAIVGAILTVADNLGLGVVAEGVEQERQREWLAGRGCPWIQGFLVQEPVGLESLLASWSAGAAGSPGAAWLSDRRHAG